MTRLVTNVKYVETHVIKITGTSIVPVQNSVLFLDCDVTLYFTIIVHVELANAFFLNICSLRVPIHISF